MVRSPILIFHVKVLAWLPITFGIWFFMAILITQPISVALDSFARWLLIDTIANIRQYGYLLETWVNVDAGPGARALVKFSVNTLLYTNGMPLYSALVLASPGEEGQKWLRWIVGVAAVYTVAMVCVGLEIVGRLPTIHGAQGQFVSTTWAATVTVLSNNFGIRLLPLLTPLIAWFLLYADYVSRLAPASIRPHKVPNDQ